MFAENSISATASTTAVVASTSIACHEDEPKTMPQPPTAAENTVVHHEEDQEVQVNEKEQRLKKRKQYLESGVGGGKKKQRIVTSFYDTLWPILEEAGWKLVKGEGKNEGAEYFLPPGVTFDEHNNGGTSMDDQEAEDASADGKVRSKKSSSNNAYKGEWECPTCEILIVDRARCKKCMGWKGGKKLQKEYLSRVRDVIERVLNSSDETETKAAEAYAKAVPDIHEQLQPKKKESSVPSESTSVQLDCQEHVNMDWKHERTHYPKATSRVGDEYQATELPKAGTYVANEQSDLYDQVWDWRKADASGKLDFCTRVTPNKKAEAYVKLQQRGFVIPGLYREVCDIPTTDGTDWSEDDKKRFRVLIFKEQKSIIKVSKALGKPMKECMGYYYGTFKKTKDYPRLKLAIYRNKERAVKTRSSNWICDTCGIGGKLIACDSCDLHFHLDCLDPPLKEVPEGTWSCSNCTTKAQIEDESAFSSQAEEPKDEGESYTKCANDLINLAPFAAATFVPAPLPDHAQCSPMEDHNEEEANPNQEIFASIKNENVKVKVTFGESTSGSEDNDLCIKRVDSDMYEGEVN